MPFYQGFTLDTLLGCVSCILGFVALFVCSKVYKNCNVNQGSYTETKHLENFSRDYSQNAGGDINNYNFDANALTNLTSATLDVFLKNAYIFFEKQNEINLTKIFEQTQNIINEQKLIISRFSKIDWINIYFECAKNAHDDYMQDIWARVLAKELTKPGSFSYKTLDVLKNMSSDCFKCFDRMCSLEIDGCVISDKQYSAYGIEYMDLIMLCELGLLNMGFSKQTYTFPPKNTEDLICNPFVIKIYNPSITETSLEYNVFVLTIAANELREILETEHVKEYLEDCIKYFSGLNNQLELSIQQMIKA